MNLKRYLPVLQWLPGYRREHATSDVIASVIVTIMLIPQSLAYALLAGLPAQVGLYASILPLVLYAVFGTSRTLSVGPVAVAALMTAAALAPIAIPGSPDYVAGAVLLALMSGLMLLIMGLLKLGFLANFLSHPVISGFMTASGLVIAASQIRHIFGIEASGHNLVEIIRSLLGGLGGIHWPTLALGAGALLFLQAARKHLKSWLAGRGVKERAADIATKTAPILVVVITTMLAWGLALATLSLTPAIAYLPAATLAATIIVAVANLIDFPALVRTWRYSRPDFGAMLATIILTLVHSVEAGIIAGVGLSIGLFMFRTSRPHSAVVVRVPGSEHFRNTQRHRVETSPRVTFLRVDESLYFANARFLEETMMSLVTRQPDLTDLVLVCPAVNMIDASALESLETINERLTDAGVRLHLAEVKGPVMDRLKDTQLLSHLGGQVFLSAFEAWRALVTSVEMPVTSTP